MTDRYSFFCHNHEQNVLEDRMSNTSWAPATTLISVMAGPARPLHGSRIRKVRERQRRLMTDGFVNDSNHLRQSSLSNTSLIRTLCIAGLSTKQRNTMNGKLLRPIVLDLPSGVNLLLQCCHRVA